MYRMLGLRHGSEAIGLTKACQMFHPDDRARVWQDVTTLIETGQPLENELRFWTACGETRTFFSRAIPVKDESGAVRLIRGFSQDVTERRAAEIELRKSQELLAQAEQIANLGSWGLSVEGERRMLSENLYRILGEDPKQFPITLEEALERTEPVDADRVRRNLDRAQNEGAAFEQEIRYRLPDGRLRTLHIRCVPMLDLSKNVARLVGVTRDVTEQRKAQRAWRESEKHYQILINSLKDHAVLGFDRNGDVISWHNGAERLMGYTAKEILGLHFSRFYPAEDISSEKPIRELDHALREGRFEGEGWRARKDGSRFWAEAVLVPRRDDEGQLMGFASITRDITERKKAEEELGKRERMLGR